MCVHRWTQLQGAYMQAGHTLAPIFFVPVVLFTVFFLLNLLLAVASTHYAFVREKYALASTLLHEYAISVTSHLWCIEHVLCLRL